MKYTFLIILLPLLLFASWNPTVQPDTRLNETVIQIASRYDQPFPQGLFQQPMNREAVYGFLQFAADSLELTSSERETITLMLQWYGGEKTLFSRSNDSSRINLSLELSGDVDIGLKDSLSYGMQGIIGPGISGNLGGLSFNTNFYVWTEFRNDTMWLPHGYQPYKGNAYNLFGREDSAGMRSSDIFRAGVSWDLGFSHWDMGVDFLKTGPSVRNPLMLNLESSPMAYLRMRLDFDWFNYTHIAGVPQSIKDGNRNMMFHRLEVPFFDHKLVAGLNGAVVYGTVLDSAGTALVHSDPLDQRYYNIDRTFEPVYLVPLLPFAFAEHFTGDRDNAILSLDLSLRLPTNFHWYVEFLLDDMSAPHTLFSDDFGNKWGLTVGGQWFGVVGEKNITVSTEYSRIEPWVYTHFRGASHRYMHYGASMGSEMGPNSDLLWIDVAYQISSKHRLSISFENQRWNREYRGGSSEHVFITETTVNDSKDSLGNTDLIGDSITKEFLAGNVQTDQIVTAEWEFNAYRLFEVNSKLSYSSRDGVGIGFTGGFRF